jgi:hypothetical protein
MTQKIHALLYGFDLPPVGVNVGVFCRATLFY